MKWSDLVLEKLLLLSAEEGLGNVELEIGKPVRLWQ